MRIPDPIANTTTEAYLAYKAGVLSEGELKPKLYDPYIHLDAWLAYWAGLTKSYPVKNVGKNLFDMGTSLRDWFQTYHDGLDINAYTVNRATATIEDNKLVIDSYDNTGWTWISRWVSLEKNTVYSISGVNTQAIRVVGFNSKEQSAQGTLIRVKPSVQSVGYVTFNTGDYDYHAISFYPAEAGSYFENIQIEKGSSRTAYEPYTGEPEMLTDEEALIAYLSGVTNTYPEEFRDPADVRVAAYLKYLVSARWGRPEYPVTNEELYLSMMDAPYIPAGEPSSDIEIDDTAEAPFKDVKMYGDTSQTTYTGKNKLEPYYSSSPVVLNGITCTYDATDQTLTFNGTATSDNTGFYFAAKNVAITENITRLTTYYVSGSHSGYCKIRFFNSTYGGNIVDLANLSSSTPISSQLSNATYSLDATKASIRFDTGATANNFKIKIMVADSNDTTYEPYVGGVPAPNPDYPQAVNTVTGRQVVKVEGKNLLPTFVGSKTVSVSGAKISYDSDGDKVILNADYSAQTETAGQQIEITTGETRRWAWTTAPAIEGYPDRRITSNGGEYTVSMRISGGEWSGNTSGSVMLIVGIVDDSTGTIRMENNTLVTTSVPGPYYVTQNVSLGENEHIRNIAFYTQNTTFDNAELTIQLEKGSEATDFEPYQGQSYEINLGKNLYDVSQALEYKWLQNPTGLVVDSSDPNIVAPLMHLEVGKTYVISGIGDLQFNLFSYTDSNFSNPVRQIINSREIRTYTAVTEWARFAIGGGDAIAIKNNIQFECGSEATDYAPYFTPIELCKIGDYQDYIYENDGKWYLHKAIGKGIYDGSEDENWTSSATYRADIAIPDAVLGSATNNPVLSNRYKAVWATANGNIFLSGLWHGAGVVDSTNMTSIPAWRTYLASNNVEIYYALDTEADTEITNTALIDQLNALKNGGSYTGTTHIKVSATDPNLPGLLKVEAYKYD